MAVVRDAVGDVGDLAFEADRFGKVFGVVVGGSVFCYCGSCFVHKVQAGEGRVRVFEEFHDSQGLFVVFKPSGRRRQFVEDGLACVAEGAVAEVVGKADCLCEGLVEFQDAGDGSAYLCDFDAVRKAGSVVVVKSGGENLCFAFEASKGGAVYDAVAVSFES